MKLKYAYILGFKAMLLLVFHSCIKEKSTLKTTPLQQNDKQKDKEIEVEKDSIKYITGEYELIYGKTYFIGSKDAKIYKGAIIIEKLSETDLGFYSAYKRKKIAPIGDFGVIRSFKNNFHNLSICDDNWINGYSKNNYTNTTYLHNQIMIQKKEDVLTVIRYGSNFRNYMIYKKKKIEDNFFISLVKTLESSKLDYEEFLVKYKKAKNYNKSKLQIEYIFEDNMWMSKHNHKEDYKKWETLHSYQNPNQNGKFIKEDSIFMTTLKKILK